MSTTCWPNENTACCFRTSAGVGLARKDRIKNSTKRRRRWGSPLIHAKGQSESVTHAVGGACDSECVAALRRAGVGGGSVAASATGGEAEPSKQ